MPTFISWVNDIEKYRKCAYRSTCFENCKRVVVSNLEKPDYLDATWVLSDVDNIGAAYNLGKKYSNSPINTFIHQDAIIVDPNFPDIVYQKFSNDYSVRLIGHIGSTNPNAIPWWNRPEDCRGQILQGFELAFWDKFNGECAVVDPFCFTTDSEMKFSEDYFGPHFIEYDYCKRLRDSGYKIYMTDSLVCHLSGGKLDNAWQKSSEIFKSKYGI